jgi:transposase
VQEELENLRLGGLELSYEITPLMNICESIRAYLKVASDSLSEFAASTEVCRRWMDIPGIGPLTALSFYTAIDDPARFAKAIDVGAYLGLVPRISQSGGSTRSGRISKRGDVLARTQLVTAAGVAMRSNSPDTDLKQWAATLKSRRGYSRARVALARKLGVIMLAMWRSGETYRPSSGRTLSPERTDPQ